MKLTFINKVTVGKAMICGMIIAASVGSTAAQVEPYRNPALSADERAADLLRRMTLDEKINQMCNSAGGSEQLGIAPYDWWNEALHGVARAGLATVFPQAIGMAATFDDNALYETFSIISDEARAKHHDFKSRGERTDYKGLTFWTPNVNIFRDPRWGRGQETYGEDPYLTSRMGVAAVRGIQGDGTHKYDKAHACAKHYAVHSGPEWNRHSFNANNVSARDLYETYLPAFKALVKEGKVKQVMCAYNRFEGEPCCSNKKLLVKLLREDWGYDDVIVSDCGAIGDFFNPKHHGTHTDAATASADAVISGTDLECGGSYHSLRDAVEKGIITEEKINESVFRLLRAKFRLGLFDDDSLVDWAKIPYSVVDSPEHRRKVLEMARKSIVLLSNRGNTLPLDKSLKKVAVLGPNAADSVMMWGNYNGSPSHTVTILEGIRNKLPNAEIVSDKACDHVDTDAVSEADFARIAGLVADADVIIFAGGISPMLEGEEMGVKLPGFRGGDRTDIELPRVQKDMLRMLKQLGKPVVFLVCTGSAIALADEDELVDAIVNVWYPGQAGGTAVADVLFGDYNPAGRLPVTFYASSSDLPDFEDYDMDGRTYRYFEGKPLYPFGHGLSYTDFAYGKAKLSSGTVTYEKPVTLTIPVTNRGVRDGDEVVQVYIRDHRDEYGPKKSLRAFRRVPISSGSTEKAEFTLNTSDFEFFDPGSKQMAIKPGRYEILYGGTSDPSGLKKINIRLK